MMHIPGIKRFSYLYFAAASVFFVLLFFMLPAVKPKAGKGDPGQRLEHLDRGLAAMRTDRGIYLSWRLLYDEDPVFGSAESAVRFTVLRDGMPIAELEGMTNFTDEAGSADSVYQVRSSGGDSSAGVRPFGSGKNYFDIPLIRPENEDGVPYTINDVSTGDLDGDGIPDLVVKWDCGGLDNAVRGHTGKTLLDAYRLDGTHLWKNPIDLGPNIRSGPHYTQFLVYDLDRDGKSEIVCKTAPGSADAAGNYVSQAASSEEIRGADDSVDLRNEAGFVLTGDEFLTVFSGGTGEALDTIYYPNQRIDSEIWGDSYGNRSERYTGAVAWLDGSRPYAVFMRGYYMGRNPDDSQRQAACAVSFDGSRLHCGYSFDTYDAVRYGNKSASPAFTLEGRYKGVDGYRRSNEIYAGEGNHNCAAADVDGDGKDEVLTGALCYEAESGDKLGVKWCSFLGHGDALHIGDYDPAHPGYEFFTVHETGGRNRLSGTKLDYGMSVLDAADGSVLFHLGAAGDTGRGMMANVGAGGYYQIWARVQEDRETYSFLPVFMKTGAGYERSEIPEKSQNFRIFWDGDLFDELLDGESGEPLTVSSWNGSYMEPVFRTEGAVSINDTKANPCLQADILGDWREELVMAREDHEALRVFISDIPTDYAVMTLLHDPVYRAGVAAEQSGYNQPPHIGFYLGEELFK